MPLKLALIGCGAVTVQKHLPLAAIHPQLEVALLVDRDLEHVQQLAARYQVAQISTDYHAALTGIDAAIIASPPASHSRIAQALLAAGVHVLVEKPMALSLAQCDAMLAASQTSGAILGVGLMRRYGESVQWIKQALQTQLLGPLLAWDAQEGQPFNWPAHSDYFLRREQAGGGVLADTGAHLLDLLLWWLGEVDTFHYRDDAEGGVEAECQLTLHFKAGIAGQVTLSRTRPLRNSARLVCQQGVMEVGLGAEWVRVQQPGQRLHLAGHGQQSDIPPATFDLLFVRQLEAWLAAIHGQASPLVSGQEARRSVALIEACYAQRQPLLLPWQ